MMESMRLAGIKVNGYRTLVDTDWSLRDVNVLIGPNATGKSNLLGCLRLIADSANGKLANSVYSDGGMGSLVFDGQGDSIESSLFIDLSTIGFTELVYYFKMRRLGISSGFDIESESEMDTDSKHSHFTRIKRTGQDIQVGLDTNEIDKKISSNINSSETVLSYPFIYDPVLATLQKYLKSWAIYSSIRTDPASVIRQAAVSRRGDTLDPNCENLVAVLHTHYTSDLEFRERIDSAMYAAYGDTYEEIIFPPGAEQQIQLAIRWSSLKRPVVAANLSDGTLRFLCIITALSQPNLPKLIAIDEPETGLHPTMMRIIAEYAKDAALRSQVIFTTHSAAFLDAFNKDAPPQTTVVSIADGKTQLKTVDSQVLARWLEEYSLGTLYRSRELENMPASDNIVSGVNIQ